MFTKALKWNWLQGLGNHWKPLGALSKHMYIYKTHTEPIHRGSEVREWVKGKDVGLKPERSSIQSCVLGRWERERTMDVNNCLLTLALRIWKKKVLRDGRFGLSFTPFLIYARGNLGRSRLKSALQQLMELLGSWWLWGNKNHRVFFFFFKVLSVLVSMSVLWHCYCLWFTIRENVKLSSLLTSWWVSSVS